MEYGYTCFFWQDPLPRPETRMSNRIKPFSPAYANSGVDTERTDSLVKEIKLGGEQTRDGYAGLFRLKKSHFS